jgi:hypothetical protein
MLDQSKLQETIWREENNCPTSGILDSGWQLRYAQKA